MNWIRKRSRGELLLLLALAVGLVYVNCLPNGFVWDDEEQIVNNVQLKRGRMGEILKGGTFYSGGAGELGGWFWRPAVMLLYAVLYQIFGLQAWGYHLLQIFLHMGVVGLGFLLLRQFWEKEWAFLGALVLGVHPLGVETVGYVAALGDIVVGLGVLLALGLFLRKEELSETEWLAVGGGLFLALLAKEAAVVGMGLLVWAGWLWRRESLGKLLGVEGLVLAIYLGLRLVVGVKLGGAGESLIGEASLGERLMTIPSIWVHYGKTFVYPSRLAICQHWVVSSFADIRFWGNLLVLLLLGGGVGWLARGNKRLRFFAGWVGLGFLLVSQIVPLEMTVAERWMYLPMMGMIGVVGEVGGELIKGKKLKKTVWWIGVLIVVALGVRSGVRVRTWRTGMALYSHDIKVSRSSWELENNLGVELIRKGRVREAQEHFEKALVLRPQYTYALNNLGVAYQRQGKMEKAREQYEKCLELSDYFRAWENLAWLRLKEDKPGQMEEWIKEGVGKLPANDDLRLVYAVVLYRQGEVEEALRQARIVVQLEASQRNLSIYQRIKEEEKIEL